jgi:colanic acid/amylovoran biosynthesis protein
MRRLCAAAELILARDSISYRCVEELISAPSDKLALAPDVTIFSEPDPTTPIPENPYACVVPNVRVLRDGEAGWRDLYLPRLLETIRFLREHDLDVVLMEHETLGGDRRIIDELLAGLSDDNVRICNYPSPFRLKAILGGARLVVASRYHAVVGALSSGVPTAVIGWAHKYEMLLTDFGVPDCIHGASGGGSHLQQLLAEFLDDQAHAARRTTLLNRKSAMRIASDRMWDDVVACLTRD